MKKKARMKLNSYALFLFNDCQKTEALLLDLLIGLDVDRSLDDFKFYLLVFSRIADRSVSVLRKERHDEIVGKGTVVQRLGDGVVTNARKALE